MRLLCPLMAGRGRLRASGIKKAALPKEAAFFPFGGREGLEAFTLQTLTLHLAGATNSFSCFAGALFGGLFEVATQLHFTKHAFALHLLLERLKRLVNIVVTNENLHGAVNSLWARSSAPPVIWQSN